MSNKGNTICQTVIPSFEGYSKGTSKFILGIHSSVLLTDIITNSLLIFCVWKLKLYNRPTYRFILIMSISDLCSGSIVQPVMMYLGFYQNCLASKFYVQPMLYFLFEISSFMILYVAADRYIHIRYLLRYDSIMTKGAAIKCIIVAFVTSIIFAGLSVLASLMKHLFLFHVILCAVQLPGLMMILVSYGKAFQSLRRRVKNSSLTTSSSNARRHVRVDIHFAYGACFITACLICCFVPYFVAGSFWMYRKFNRREVASMTVEIAYTMSVCLFLINSCTNALALMYTDKKMRRFLVALFRRAETEESSAVVETTRSRIRESRF